MKVSYNWLKEYLGEDAPSANEIADLLTFKAFEIEETEEKDGDTVIDVDVLPNRSSDCLSHRGIAREIATIIDRPLAKDALSEVLELENTDLINVEIESEDSCPRFTASLIKDVEIKESPEWLKQRLQVLGQRPINNIVDATNYVMLAMGQPMHAYDADKFPQTDGKWKFVVRKSKPGEVVSLIAESGKDEDRDVELSGSELLIVDGTEGTLVGLAGVKGGRFAGIDEGTKNIIVEAAHFDPILTRKTARGLGIVIEASKRFENEPSRELPLYAQNDIKKLIADIAGGKFVGAIDIYPNKKESMSVMVSPTRANSLLGLSLDIKQMKDILERAGCIVEESAGNLKAVGPFERTDLNIEEDFIEEIGRIYGYEHVESIVPDSVALTEINTRHYYSEKVRDVLTAKGFSEVITSSFRKKDNIQLANALASDKSFLRSVLSKNITEALDRNINNADLLGTTDTRVFEIGTVFTGGEGEVFEHMSVSVGVRIKSTGYSGKEDKILDEAVTAIEESLGASLKWSKDKGVAEANLSAVLGELAMPEIYDKLVKEEDINYKTFSNYPFISRDISLWVSGSASEELRNDLEGTLKDVAGELCIRITLFDEFTKDERTSYAFRLIYQSKEKTLTDEEVNEVMDEIYKVAKKQDWEVR